MEFDPIQGTVAHQKKRLPTQPHDTLSLGRCPTSLPFLGGASFVHTKLLLQRGAARSISLEETPRQGFGSDVQSAWGQKFLESWNTRYLQYSSVIFTANWWKMPRLQYPTPVDVCCFCFFLWLEWWNLTRSGLRGRTNPKRPSKFQLEIFPPFAARYMQTVQFQKEWIKLCSLEPESWHFRHKAKTYPMQQPQCWRRCWVAANTRCHVMLKGQT